MLLATRFFSINDFFLVPICFVLMYAIIRNRAINSNNPKFIKYYYKAFYFKVVCVFAYTIITEFYFGGGDTSLYYQGVQDLRAAVFDDSNNFFVILKTSGLDESNPLAPFFLYDDYVADLTYNYMQGASNFFVPRLGFFPSLVFYNSYLCICLCMSMLALGGSIRLFKLFYHYYPDHIREIALACLFLPSVGFWSSGLLKDTICFGCVGFMVYGVFNIVILRRKVFTSLVWIGICGYLLFVIKTYIFLVLLLAIIIWLFAETNKLIKDRTLRQIFAFMSFSVAVGAVYFLLQYFTSEETLKQYQLENIISSAEQQREVYRTLYESTDQAQQVSYYSIQTSNPILLIVNSIIATFYRPFPWEVRSAAAVLSAIEAFAFIILTLHLFFKRGFGGVFREIFRDPRILLCFIFAIVFAIGVGASTANFGTLSRYKIPCMPFYLIMILLLYRNLQLRHPKWLDRILGYQKK
jgi:hypothetical protein